MADTWVSDITHFLDQNGNLIEGPKEARVLADYFAAIIVMASYPEPDYGGSLSSIHRTMSIYRVSLASSTSAW